MTSRLSPWFTCAALGAVSLLAACSLDPSTPVASNPPPQAPGMNATWYHVNFTSASYAISSDEQKTISDVSVLLRRNPALIATIVGKTDTVGGQDYNMHLSHQRADAVRDALIYHNDIAADRVETRWTGEGQQKLPTANEVAAASNRVVDIAIH